MKPIYYGDRYAFYDRNRLSINIQFPLLNKSSNSKCFISFDHSVFIIPIQSFQKCLKCVLVNERKRPENGIKYNASRIMKHKGFQSLNLLCFDYLFLRDSIIFNQIVIRTLFISIKVSLLSSI